jgi:hypothetical protein
MPMADTEDLVSGGAVEHSVANVSGRAGEHGRHLVGGIAVAVMAFVLSGCGLLEETQSVAMTFQQRSDRTVQVGQKSGMGVRYKIDIIPALIESGFGAHPREGEWLVVADPGHVTLPIAYRIEPSSGAAIVGGVFTASKPGAYKVSLLLGDGVRDTVTVTVAEQTENPFAGTYKGTMDASGDLGPAEIPWSFTVDADGKVKGGYQHAWSSEVKVKCTFSGTVSDDGRLVAPGTMTVSSGAGSTSESVELDGKISGTAFVGSFNGSGGSFHVTAERQ